MRVGQIKIRLQTRAGIVRARIAALETELATLRNAGARSAVISGELVALRSEVLFLAGLLEHIVRDERAANQSKDQEGSTDATH